jgi:peptidoglycan/LPS O-acetylase OafA/YrhL
VLTALWIWLAAIATLESVVVIVIVLIFVLMTLVATGATRRLARPWFALAGNITYPLYLIHAHIGIERRAAPRLRRLLAGHRVR